MNLQLDRATIQIAQLKKETPDNLAIDFIEDYVDFLKIYLSEDRSLYKKIEKNESQRLDRLSNKAIVLSPYTKYAKSEVLLHWALVQLKFGNYLSAFTRIKRAYHLLTINQKEYPKFSPNLKSLGILHGLLSTVPDELKWIIKTLGGMEGNIDQAKFELEQVMLYSGHNEYIFKNEAMAMYGLLMANFDNDPVSALNLMKKSALNPEQSPLFTYIFANLSLKNGDNDLAIQYLKNTPKGAEYFTFPYLDFMLGEAKLRRLDMDASAYLKKYITEFHGLHYIKECYQKLAWAELIKGNHEGYIENIQAIKKYGARVMDEDKQAQREAERNIMPNVILLKSRLLFDGGYLLRAQELIESNPQLLTHHDFSLEANYRLGRIYHQLNKYDLAIAFYQQAIAKGMNSPYHYACASCLYIGTIYEAKHDTRQARTYFEKCMTITSGDYSSSLHQKAKTGLNRLKD